MKKNSGSDFSKVIDYSWYNYSSDHGSHKVFFVFCFLIEKADYNKHPPNYSYSHKHQKKSNL